MKTLILITLTMALGLMGVGCSKSNSQNNNVTTTAPVVNDPAAPTVNSGGAVFTSGSTADFKPVSKSVMQDYANGASLVGVTRVLNNPTNYKINIDLSQAAAGRYAGQITISYMDNGTRYDGVFVAGSGTNQSLSGKSYDNGRPEADYNYWFKLDNQIVFTGFFQDQYGAFTLTLIPETSTTSTGNDAEPITTTTYKGSIYYKNFPKEVNGVLVDQQSPYRYCWYIYTGPYDCRSNVIQTKCGLYPGSETGYKLLGTFSGINVTTAFNMQ